MMTVCTVLHAVCARCARGRVLIAQGVSRVSLAHASWLLPPPPPPRALCTTVCVRACACVCLQAVQTRAVSKLVRTFQELKAVSTVLEGNPITPAECGAYLEYGTGGVPRAAMWLRCVHTHMSPYCTAVHGVLFLH